MTESSDPTRRSSSNPDDEIPRRANKFRSNLGIKPPRRRWLLWVALIAFIGIDVALWLALEARRGQRITLPAANEIDKILVKLPKLSETAPAAEFELDERHIEPLLAAFQPAARTPIDKKFLAEPLGTITIETFEGKRLTLTFFDAGQSSVRFTLDGISGGRAGAHKPVWTNPDEYANEGLLLRTLLQEINRAERDGSGDAKINDLLRELKQSKGDIPPSRRHEA